MILNMLPILSQNYMRYSFWRDFINFTECYATHAIRGLKAYFLNLFYSQFRGAIPLSPRRSFFISAIFFVFFLSSSEQMIGIDTWGIIAGMANKFPFGDWSKVYSPGSMGCAKVLPLYRKTAKNPVTIFVSLPRPKPTRFCLFNFLPKSFCERSTYAGPAAKSLWTVFWTLWEGIEYAPAS